MDSSFSFSKVAADVNALAIFWAKLSFTRLNYSKNNYNGKQPIFPNYVFLHPLQANLAQLVEQRYRKPQVAGSNPVVGST